VHADKILAETLANEFGEFQLQFDQTNGLQIYVDIPEPRPVGILLPDLVSPPATEETAID
jgi:hypothetical protein